MSDAYHPVTGTAIARLADRVTSAVLEKRPELVPIFEESGGRIEDDPRGDGVSLWIGDQCIARLSAAALRYGLQMEEAQGAN
jgi:hypothetical protein